MTRVSFNSAKFAAELTTRDFLIAFEIKPFYFFVRIDIRMFEMRTIGFIHEGFLSAVNFLSHFMNDSFAM